VFGLGKTEDLIIILLIILLLFGAKKIPDLARSIGQSAREIRKGFNGEEPDQPVKTTSAAKKTKSSK
jgi:sec-independent protein translocase protein TatA